jgi:transposase
MTVKHGSFDGVVRPLIEMDEVLAHALVPLLAARVVLDQHFLKVDRRVKRAASQDEVCMRMMTVPGVGRSLHLHLKPLSTTRRVSNDHGSSRVNTTILGVYQGLVTKISRRLCVLPPTYC